MKRLLVPALAVASLAATAVPAFAQPYGYNRGGGVNAQEARIERRIERGLRDGSLTRREAFRLRAELRDLDRLEWRYRRTGGLSSWERRDLDRRLDRLARRVFAERHDWQERRW